MTRRPRSTFTALVAAFLLVTACSSSAETAGSSSGDIGESGATHAADTVPTLYWLDVYANAVHRATGPDFTDAEVLVANTDEGPDGVDVDVEGGKLYWTSMGNLLGQDGQLGGEHPPPGSLQRANLDGTGVEQIVGPGMTRTPKQLDLDLEHGHVYWSDRDDPSIWRVGLDGTDPQPVVTGHGLREPVGVAVDVAGGHLYFSDKAGKRILRAGLQVPAGQTAADRTDVEEVVVLEGVTMPVDLVIDHENRELYWTDRLAGTVTRAGLDLPAGQTAATRADLETVMERLDEPIGIALDVPANRLYYGELGRGVSEATLDGEDAREVGRATGVTGIALVHEPVG